MCSVFFDLQYFSSSLYILPFSSFSIYKSCFMTGIVTLFCAEISSPLSPNLGLSFYLEWSSVSCPPSPSRGNPDAKGIEGFVSSRALSYSLNKASWGEGTAPRGGIPNGVLKTPSFCETLLFSENPKQGISILFLENKKRKERERGSQRLCYKLLLYHKFLYS